MMRRKAQRATGGGTTYALSRERAQKSPRRNIKVLAQRVAAQRETWPDESYIIQSGQSAGRKMESEVLQNWIQI